LVAAAVRRAVRRVFFIGKLSFIGSLADVKPFALGGGCATRVARGCGSDFLEGASTALPVARLSLC
jgi:hypothetical protein